MLANGIEAEGRSEADDRAEGKPMVERSVRDEPVSDVTGQRRTGSSSEASTHSFLAFLLRIARLRELGFVPGQVLQQARPRLVATENAKHLEASVVGHLLRVAR